jgi:hypothetical protein
MESKEKGFLGMEGKENTMQDFTRKIGKNRGNARVWIEHKALTLEGWTRGTRYNVAQSGRGLLLTRADNGARKVCGKEGKHPIIDLTSKELSTILAPSGIVSVVVTPELIMVKYIGQTEKGIQEGRLYA